MTLDDVWPLFGITLATPRLVLRPVRDEDLPHVVEAIASGLHDPARTPFAAPWADAPADELPLNTARWIWQQRSGTSPEKWTVAFGIWTHDGALLGVQDVAAKNFPALRTVETGSWLRQSEQGQGVGTEMRVAVLLWAFDHLGAEVAMTSAYEWNAASLGVSRRLGYAPNGEGRHSPRPGVVERELRFRLAREDFKRPDWQLTVSGAEAAAAFLGVPSKGAKDDGGRLPAEGDL
ncbi:GNAT family protein [Sinomonas sp. ASV322]|uniref:GNAT family N-acetyltransferase n=1 Tax=Sinomonas sp. ASV322 TaxID=3041920 RepID=UPI0027DBEEB0|nr:GNAT family protein [Sinomonas sp. ASV322]MDQ4503679.1 GNAT family protein [Sinomonas sp. ASV322]